MFVCSQIRKSEFLESVNARIQDGSQLVGRDVTLRFISRSKLPAVNDSDTVSVSNGADSGILTVLTVLTDCVTADHCFNEEIYRQHLNTRVLGNVVLYADVTTTTMHLLDRLASPFVLLLVSSFYSLHCALLCEAAVEVVLIISVIPH